MKQSEPSPPGWKGEIRQEHGMHFDGIVAGLGRQSQKKIAKKWRRFAGKR
jgi:hypothetical protein